MANNTINAQSPKKSEPSNEEQRKVRLRVLLLPYTVGNLNFSIDEELDNSQTLSLLGNKISGSNVSYQDSTPTDSNTDIKDIYLKITEKKNSFKSARKSLENKLTELSQIYKTITLNIIIPSDCECSVSVGIALCIILDDVFLRKFKKIDINNSTVVYMLVKQNG